MGVPPVIIHFRLGFSLTKTIQLLGDPQSILLTIYEGFLKLGYPILMDGLQWKIPSFEMDEVSRGTPMTNWNPPVS